MRNWDFKTGNSILILNFGNRNSKSIPKTQNFHLKISNSISILNLGAGNLISKIPKSISLIPFEFRFGTPKFEIAVVENPQIYIFSSKSNFSSTKILILY